jgi:hypothetical protein
VVAAARLLGEARERVGGQIGHVVLLREVDRGVLRPGRPDHHGEDFGEVVAVGDPAGAGA